MPAARLGAGLVQHLGAKDTRPSKKHNKTVDHINGIRLTRVIECKPVYTGKLATGPPLYLAGTLTNF